MSKPKKAERTLPDEGAHNAICKAVYDCGTQESKNEKFPARPLVVFIFELVDLSTKDKPAYIAHRVTNIVSSKSNLAKMLKSWLQAKNPEDLDLDECLNKPAIVTIVHSADGNYANIETVTAPTKGTKMSKGFMTANSFYLDENFDREAFEAAPEWIQNLAVESPEFDEVDKPKKPVKKAGGKK